MDSKTFTYKTDSKGTTLPTTVYYSTTPNPAPRPIALLFHAGGFALGSTAMVPRSQISALAKMGFVAVTPEYRLAPQVGMYDGCVQDAKDCLKWAQTQLPAALAEQAPGVQADGSRVVAVGHSAGGNLALHLGGVPDPVKAVLDFYSPKNFTDLFYTSPLPIFAKMPPQDKAYIDKVMEGPQVVTSGPMIVGGKPDFSSPRVAWFIDSVREGTNLGKVVVDGNVERVDPLNVFSEKFPPTYFVHGDADPFVPLKSSQAANEKLAGLGVETELVTVPGKEHMFDLELKEEDELFQNVVMKALKFLSDHV